MFSIQTNVASLYGQQNLTANSKFQQTTITRLTSGYRINSSADDAAGLAVANSLRSTRTELSQGVRNGNDGVSQLQIVDGGLNNISQILDRLKTLATQAASGTFTGDYTTLDNEFKAQLQEIDRQAANIGLNNGGTFNAMLSVYIGGGVGMNGAQMGTANEVVGLDNSFSVSYNGVTGAGPSTAAVTYGSGVSSSGTSAGYTSYFQASTGTATAYYSASQVASSSAGATSGSATVASSTSLAYGQVNAVDSGALKIAYAAVTAASSSVTYSYGAVGSTSSGSAAYGAAINVQNSNNAQDALNAIQAAVVQLGKVQGVVGSGINKLNFSISLAQSQITNYAASESRIRDADIAQEASNLTKASTLQQSSMAALAQANQIPQSILRLLS